MEIPKIRIVIEIEAAQEQQQIIIIQLKFLTVHIYYGWALCVSVDSDILCSKIRMNESRQRVRRVG